MITSDKILNAFKDWKVYKYIPREGIMTCPHCRNVVKSANGGLLPPFYCGKDKVFFDPDLRGQTSLNQHVLIAGEFFRGDLRELVTKYITILQLLKI